MNIKAVAENWKNDYGIFFERLDQWQPGA